jgi:hypothetical protein
MAEAEISIRKEHRDVLWAALHNRLAGIGDVWLRLQADDYPEAKELGAQYQQDLGLMAQVGWHPARGAAPDLFKLGMDPRELAAIATRLREEAKAALKAGGEEQRAAEALKAHNQSYALLAESCQDTLAALAIAAEMQTKR